MNTLNVNVNININVNQQRIKDLLRTALEQGVGHWASWAIHPTYTAPHNHHKRYHINDPQWALTIKDYIQNKSYTLNQKTLSHGIQLFAKLYPIHFQFFVNKNEDAEIADLFLQTTLLGKATYC
jgi:hypothetical protein